MREFALEASTACQAARIGLPVCTRAAGSMLVVEEGGRPFALCEACRGRLTAPEFEARVRELEDRIANVHTEIGCERCGAPVGFRCVRVGKTPGQAPPLKAPHRERWTKVVPAR
jgi:hypothetical protein